MALRSVLLGQRKLIFNEVDGSMLLYGLSDDPREQHNLYDQGTDDAASLEPLLLGWIEHVKSRQGPGPARDALELLTPEQREQLEAMGYL